MCKVLSRSADPALSIFAGGTWPRNAGFTLVGDVLPSLKNAIGTPTANPTPATTSSPATADSVASTDAKHVTPIAELFTDPASPKYDFALPADSPGVNIVPCQILPSPPFALGPSIRPLGTECDAGAYER